MGGFGRRMPGIAACFTLGGLSSLGLPGLAGFVAEILTFLGAWQSASGWWLFPAVLGTLLTAIYVLRVAKRIFWGPLAGGPHGEWAALARRPGARVGEPGLPLGHPHPLRARAGARTLARRPGDRGAPRPDRGAAVMLLALELGVAALALVVFLLGLGGRGRGSREIGLVTAVGLAGLYGLSLVIDARGPLFDGAFIVDDLAVFLKQVFLLATLLAVVGGLARRDAVERRRGLEYHVLVLTALLGMMVLASARELVLLFVAFELMSIPLYVLAGFVKKDARAVEASLKFFLVGSLSTAFLVYGLSFVYGVTGSTRLDVVTRAVGAGDPLLILGLAPGPRRGGIQDRGLPVPHVGAGYLRGGGDPVRRLAVGGAEGGRVRRAAPHLRRARGAAGRALGGGGGAPRRADDRGRQRDGDPPDGREAAPRLLRDRPHRLHAARRGGAFRGRRGDAALLPGGVPVLEHGRLHGRGGRGRGRGLVRAPDASGGSPSARRRSGSRCSCSCSRWGASRSWWGSGPSSTSSGRRPRRGSTGWCCWRR